jgi:hypothetical protein
MHVYEHRIIAYADILGWSNSCNDLSQVPCLLKAAGAIADYAHKFSLSVKESLKNATGVSPVTIEQHAGIGFSFFSDNFAVSAPVAHVQIIFKILAFATHELLRWGFLIRGAVTLGYLYHDYRGIIFGPALIEAVHMEKNARYPRLLCSDRLIEFLNTTDYREQVIVCDCDKKWVANIAYGSSHAMDDLNKIIEEKLTIQTNVMDKWQYMQEMLPLMYEAYGKS